MHACIADVRTCSRSENEQEQQAVRALLHATRLSPQDMGAWLSLATAYTNEVTSSGHCVLFSEVLMVWVQGQFSDAANTVLEMLHAQPSLASFLTSQRTQQNKYAWDDVMFVCV